MSGTVTMGKQGRVVLPAELRTELGLQEGTTFEVSSDGDLIQLRRRLTPPEAARRLRGMFADIDRDLVGELIAERRAEAERDDRP